MTDFFQLVIYGLVLGAMLALGACGVSLIFGVLRFAHFAHGDLMTVGAYSVFLLHVQLALPWWLALSLGIPVTAVCAVVLDRLFYRRLRRSPPVILLISSSASALILRGVVQMIWGPDILVYDNTIEPVIRLAGLRIAPDHILILALTVIAATTLTLFLRFHTIGKCMRALADNPDLARLCAIPTESVITMTWVSAAALATCAGVAVGLDSQLQPELGWHLLLPVFAAAILGGIGNPHGALAGGFVIGIATELSTLVIPPAYKNAVAFLVIVLCLILRPRGIFPATRRSS